MFAPPRPILPRSTPIEPEPIPVENAPGLSTTIPTDDEIVRPARPETAWERGLRQVIYQSIRKHKIQLKILSFRQRK
jgi:hypothetical protein